jgi:hypothetical protein
MPWTEWRYVSEAINRTSFFLSDTGMGIPLRLLILSCLATVDSPNKDLPYEKLKCPVHFQRLQEKQESDSSLIKSFKEKHARKLWRRNLPNLPNAMRQWRLQQARELQAIGSEETDYRGDC